MSDTGAPARGSDIPVALRFLMLFALFEGVAIVSNITGWFEWLQVATASVTTWLLGLVGIPVTLIECDLYLDSRVLLIDLECTGLFLFSAFAALVLSQRVPWKDRGLALVAGIPAIALLNIVRLVAVGVISERAPEYFYFTHDILFQVGMAFGVLALWFLWMKKVRA